MLARIHSALGSLACLLLTIAPLAMGDIPVSPHLNRGALNRGSLNQPPNVEDKPPPKASATSSPFRIDTGMGLFFPKKLEMLSMSQTEFPVFWWNFIIVEPKGLTDKKEPDWLGAKTLCEDLRNSLRAYEKVLICENPLKDLLPTLKSWAEDFTLRESVTKDNELKDLLATLRSTLAEASFAFDPTQLELLRQDPFQTWQEYLALSNENLPPRFQRARGFLLDPLTNRIVIPLQFFEEPGSTRGVQLSQHIETVLQKHGAHWVGSHGAAFTNQNQVHRDLDQVTLASIFVFGIILFFLIFKRRMDMLLLFLPVALSLLLSGLVVCLIYGSIHGLTLAFGSGIAGLALDYGLHGSFTNTPQTWKSNLLGWLTTLSGVGIMAFCRVPLIGQMMVFSSLGITFGFFMFWLIFSRIRRTTISSEGVREELLFRVPQPKIGALLIFILILASFIGVYQAEMSLDLRELNFEKPEQKGLTEWFFRETTRRDMILLQRKNPFEKTQQPLRESQFLWAKENKIQYEGPEKYFPSSEKQLENSRDWRELGCPYFTKNLSAQEQNFFKPFFDSVCTAHLDIIDSQESALKRNYLLPYFSNSSVHSSLNSLQTSSQTPSQIEMFWARSDLDLEKIKAHEPTAQSLPDSLRDFSSTLKEDLEWMIPTSFILCMLLLFYYYRKWRFVLAAVTPFLSGFGVYFLVATFLKVKIDLIAILGLVMVFGFSLDYGIFATDIVYFSKNFPGGLFEIRRLQVRSALTWAALINISGFFPLLWAHHNVLHQLGLTLFWGTLGTYLGCTLGVPYLLTNLGSQRTISAD